MAYESAPPPNVAAIGKAVDALPVTAPRTEPVSHRAALAALFRLEGTNDGLLAAVRAQIAGNAEALTHTLDDLRNPDGTYRLSGDTLRSLVARSIIAGAGVVLIQTGEALAEIHALNGMAQPKTGGPSGEGPPALDSAA